MASGDTKTEALLNILGHGGTGDEYRGSGNTKTQNYILDAIDRINSLDPGGGGGNPFTVLTDADINWQNPETGDRYIALWLLPTGKYMLAPDAEAEIVGCLFEENGSYYESDIHSSDENPLILITSDGSYAEIMVLTSFNGSIRTSVYVETGVAAQTMTNFMDLPFTGPLPDADGQAGLVPAPHIADGNKFLKGNGTWANVNEVEYVELTLTGPSQQGLAVTASKYMDEVLDLAEGNKRVVFRITLPSGTGYPTSGTYELPLFNYEDNEKALAMTVVALGGTLYSIIFGYDLSGIVGDHTNVGNIAIEVLPTGGSGPTEIMYLAYYPGEDPATPGESCLYADAGLTTKLTGGDFWDILASGNPVVLRYNNTSDNEFETFSFLYSQLPSEKTIAGFDSCTPEARFCNLLNRTIYVSFVAGDPDVTDGFSIGM